MRKEIILIIGLAVIALIWLFGYVGKDIKSDSYVLNSVTYEPLENYLLITEDNQSIVENKNIGLRMIVPDEWIVKKIEGIGVDDKGTKEGSIVIYSPDSEISATTSLAQKGCGISFRSQESLREKQFHNIGNTIEHLKTGNQIQGSELIMISGKEALWEIFLEDPEIGKAIMVSLPIGERIYIFETIFPPKEEERCNQSFRDFLTKIEIIK